MGRLHFIESEAEAVHGPLRALPPEDVFEDDECQLDQSRRLAATSHSSD